MVSLGCVGRGGKRMVSTGFDVLLLRMYVDQVPRSDQRLVFHGTPNCLVGNLS